MSYRSQGPGALPALAAMLLLAAPVPAADLVGMTFVDGRQVELLSDGTWRFVSLAPPSECGEVEAPVRFCGWPPEWSGVASQPPLDRTYVHESGGSGAILVEPLVAGQTLRMDFLREMVLRSAALRSGIRFEDLVPLAETEAEVDGLPGRTLAVPTKMGGLDMVHMITLVVAEGWSAQLITLTTGPGFGEAEQAVHRDFLSQVRIDR